MMKQQLINAQVERILSLIIILYAIYCIGRDLVTIIYVLLIAYQLDSGFLQIIASSLFYCAVILFCRPIVQQIAYYATGEKRRSRRVWNAQDFAAIPFIFCAAWQIFSLVFAAVVVLPIILWNNASSLGMMEFFIQVLSFIAFILISFAFVVITLFFARSIAGWLLRRIEKTVY